MVLIKYFKEKKKELILFLFLPVFIIKRLHNEYHLENAIS